MKAVIYARKSTAEAGTDDDQKSVARQIDNARAFAAAKGWDVVQVFADDAVSGAETTRLVNRQRLLGLLETGGVDVLIMRDASRFSRRDGDEAFGELKRIARSGIAIWFYQDQTTFEYGNFAANITGFVRAEMNAEYRRQIARWVSEAMVRKARAGHVTGSRCYGYDNVRVGGHVELQINPTEAAIVRRIFELCADGAGYTRIAKQLNAEGIPGPRDVWSLWTVSYVLNRTTYRGERLWNQTKGRDVDGKKHRSRRPEDQWLRQARPDLRIVSDALWKAAHARIAKARQTAVPARRRAPARDRDSRYLLVGFVRCAECGGGMHVRYHHTREGRRAFYACTTHFSKGNCSHKERWAMEALDRRVLESLASDALDPSVVEEVLAAARKLHGQAQRGSVEKALRQRLAAVTQEQARLADAIAQGGQLAALVARLRAADERQREISEQLETLTRPAAGLRPWSEIEASARRWARRWREALTGVPAETRDTLRRLLVGPILLRPSRDRDGRVLRYEGQWDRTAFFGQLVMNLGLETQSQDHYLGRFHGMLRRRQAA